MQWLAQQHSHARFQCHGKSDAAATASSFDRFVTMPVCPWKLEVGNGTWDMGNGKSHPPAAPFVVDLFFFFFSAYHHDSQSPAQ